MEATSHMAPGAAVHGVRLTVNTYHRLMGGLSSTYVKYHVSYPIEPCVAVDIIDTIIMQAE
eukprot:1868358-Pleurochrysis_carterae.AAC.1